MWWLLTVAAVAFTVLLFTDSTVADISLSCRKTGVYDDPPSTVRCGDSMVSLVGAWPLISLGLLLVTPPTVAALAMRRWVSWTMVAALLGLSFAGLAQWASLWGQLLVAIPMAVVAFAVAVVHQFVGRTRARRGHLAPAGPL